MRVVDQVVLNRQDDQTVGLVADTVDLAEDPGDCVGGQVDVTVAAGVAAAPPCDRGTRVEAPWRNPADDGDLSAIRAS